MGIDHKSLPESIRQSEIFTAEQLLQLASVDEVPLVDPSYHDERLKNIFQYYAINPVEMEKELHCYARELLEIGKVEAAWQVLLLLN